MGPGAALDAFLAEAPRSQVVIGPDGEVAPGKYDRVAVTVRDRGELRALRVPAAVRTAALAVWLDEGTSALALSPRPEWPELQLIRSRAVDGGWLVVLRFAAALPVHRVVAELGRQAVWPEGRYSTLAGFCEPGETLEDAVRREVQEETGVVVGDVEYFGNQPWPMPASLMLGFTARAETTDIRVDEHEIEEARWLTRAQMRAEAEAGTLVLPGGVSISRSLVEHWYGGPLPGSW